MSVNVNVRANVQKAFAIPWAPPKSSRPTLIDPKPGNVVCFILFPQLLIRFDELCDPRTDKLLQYNKARQIYYIIFLA